MTKKLYTVNMTPEEVIERLQKKEVIKSDINDSVIKMINGVIVLSDSISAIINIRIDADDECYYFEDTEPFQITETGLYKTRDGRKAFVSQIELNYDESAVSRIYGTVDNEIEIYIWNSNGRRGISESNYDIVSKWEE